MDALIRSLNLKHKQEQSLCHTQENQTGLQSSEIYLIMFKFRLIKLQFDSNVNGVRDGQKSSTIK